MTGEKRKLFEFYKQFGSSGIGVEYEIDSHSVTFKSRQCISFDAEGNPVDWGSSCEGMTPEFEQATRYVDGFCKWDKCCHFWFGDEDAYLHLCDQVDEFADFVKFVTARCGELMGGYDE